MCVLGTKDYLKKVSCKYILNNICEGTLVCMFGSKDYLRGRNYVLGRKD